MKLSKALTNPLLRVTGTVAITTDHSHDTKALVDLDLSELEMRITADPDSHELYDEFTMYLVPMPELPKVTGRHNDRSKSKCKRHRREARGWR